MTDGTGQRRPGLPGCLARPEHAAARTPVAITLSTDCHQMLRAAGLLTVACVAAFLPFYTTPASPRISTLLLAGFVALFWRSTAPLAFDAPGGTLNLVGQSVIALVLTGLRPFFLLANLMVTVSWQAGLRLPPCIAAGLAATQTTASALVLMLSLGRPEVLTYVGVAQGFQVFGLPAGACRSLAGAGDACASAVSPPGPGAARRTDGDRA